MGYPVASIVLGGILAFIAATLVAYIPLSLGFPLPHPDKRIGCIDGMRGYLALSVMIYHSVIWLQITLFKGTWSSPNVNWIEQVGRASVDLFFMTTGFVFYPVILKGFYGINWLAVAISRAFRILPLMLGSIALVLAVVMWRTGRVYDEKLPRALMHWFLGAIPPLLGYNAVSINAGVLWSLFFEWIFYLFILPFCAMVRTALKPSWPTLIIPVILVASAAIGKQIKPLDVFQYVPFFAVGMLSFEIQRRPALRLTFSKGWFGGVAAASLGCDLAFTNAPLPSLVTLPFMAIFFVAVACGNPLWGAFSTRGALVLGECSYGIYLIHGFVLRLRTHWS